MFNIQDNGSVALSNGAGNIKEEAQSRSSNKTSLISYGLKRSFGVSTKVQVR